MDFILSAVEKNRRDLSISRKQRVDAKTSSTTYLIPDEVSLAALIDFYREALGSSIVYSCRARDCGGSNYWANNVFHSAILYGPDNDQFYAAAQLDDRRLVMVYLVQRGNKRRYAHVVELETRAPVTTGRNINLVEELTGRGFASVGGVEPGPHGELTKDSLELLRGLGERLRSVVGRVFVVCHVYGAEAAEVLIERSQGCAQQAAGVLHVDGGPDLVPFGAGPMMPADGIARPRLELVVPRRLQHE